MILIVSNKNDITSDFFVSRANSIGLEYFRLNTEDFPTNVDVCFQIDSKGKVSGYIDDGHSRVDLSAIKGIWYRRPRPSEISNQVTDKHIQELCVREATVSLEGIIKSIDCNWVSHPDRIRAAESKVYQLCKASYLGLRLPRTIITNVKSEILAFGDAHGKNKGSIIKTISSGRFESDEGEYLFYTNLIHLQDGLLEGAHYTANYLQEFVNKEADIRVNVFGTKVFATRIDFGEHSHRADVDWRKHQDEVKYQTCDLPSELENLCINLVRVLGLSFSAMDFVLDESGEYYFLEMNPNGQWAWIEEKTGADLFGALVNVLCEERL